jgi:hypothetical protein
MHTEGCVHIKVKSNLSTLCSLTYRFERVYYVIYSVQYERVYIISNA